MSAQWFKDGEYNPHRQYPKIAFEGDLDKVVAKVVEWYCHATPGDPGVPWVNRDDTKIRELMKGWKEGMLKFVNFEDSSGPLLHRAMETVRGWTGETFILNGDKRDYFIKHDWENPALAERKKPSEVAHWLEEFYQVKIHHEQLHTAHSLSQRRWLIYDKLE